MWQISKSASFTSAIRKRLPVSKAIIVEELSEAAKTMPTGKSAGINKIPLEFDVTFSAWSVSQGMLTLPFFLASKKAKIQVNVLITALSVF